MKKIHFLYMILTTAVIYTSCSKDETGNLTSSSNDTYVTSAEQHVVDSVMAVVKGENPSEDNNLKAARAVTISFNQLNCNTFNLSVNLNQSICPRQGLPLKAIITVFDSQGNRQLPAKTYNSCLPSNLARFDLNIAGTDYLYVVLLVMEGSQVHSLFVSSTIILKPTC